MKKSITNKKAKNVKDSVAEKVAASKKTKSTTKKCEAKPVDSTTAAKAAKPARRRVKFTITAEPGLPVYVAGTFNDWASEEFRLKEADGVYSGTLLLAPGTYEYKFIVNGFWTMDPDPTREWVANGLGTLNSIVRVD